MLIWAVFWLLFANAIMSWLVAFEIINLRNRHAFSFVQLLDRATRPILRPIQRFVPTLGGIDFSAMIVMAILLGIDRYLLPPFVIWLQSFFQQGTPL
jgi:YggT family protein